MRANWAILVVLLVGAAGLSWYYRDAFMPPAPPPVTPAATPGDAETATRAPVHPLPATEFDAPSGTLVPLPPLDESDSYFALALAELFGDNVGTLLVGEGLVDRTAATLDSLTRGRVPERVRPIGRLPGAFVADVQGTNGPYTLSAENYARYDALVAMFTGASVDELVATYARFYPLFQEAYVRLGYPDGYFNDRVVYVIDHLLQTPAPGTPIPLTRPHVLYEYADPELEALSSGQKLLLRMGPENAARVQQTLARIRDRITTATLD